MTWTPSTSTSWWSRTSFARRTSPGAADDVAQVEAGGAQDDLGMADPVDGGRRDEGESAPDPDDKTAHRRVHLPVVPAGDDVVEPADLLAGLVPHRAAEKARPTTRWSRRHPRMRGCGASGGGAGAVGVPHHGNDPESGVSGSARLVDGGVAMELPPVASLEGPVRIGRLVGAARHTRGSATGVCLRAILGFEAQGTRVARDQLGHGVGHAPADATGGFAPRHGRTSFSVVPVRKGSHQQSLPGDPTGPPHHGIGPRTGSHRGRRGGYRASHGPGLPTRSRGIPD